MYIFTGCELDVDLVFVLDVSLSIGNNERFKTVTDFASSVVTLLNVGRGHSLVGVILFARHANVLFHIREHLTHDELVMAIQDIIYDEIPLLNRTGTNIPEALDLLRTTGERGGALRLRRNNPTKSKIVVFITDGRANTKGLTGNSQWEDARNTKDAAARLHEADIYDQIYTVGIRGSEIVNFRELDFISSDPSLTFIIEDFNTELFEELKVNFTNTVCGRKYLNISTKMFLTLNMYVRMYMNL